MSTVSLLTMVMGWLLEQHHLVEVTVVVTALTPIAIQPVVAGQTMAQDVGLAIKCAAVVGCPRIAM